MSDISTNTPKPVLPNASAVLVLGILSIIPFGCVPLGLIIGIIGLVLSKDGLLAYRHNPDQYSGYGTLNSGRVLCIIGVILGSINIVWWIIILSVGGAIATSLVDFFAW